MRRLVLGLSLLLIGAGGSKRPPSIQGLHVYQEDETLVVNFELQDAFDEPTLERIHSGLPTEFRYIVRLDHPHRWWWFDPAQARTIVEISVTFNAVTQEYLVNTKHDGDLIDSRVVTETEELQRSMTMVSSLAFELQREPRRNSFVRVRAELGSRNFMLLFRRTIATNWARAPLERQG